MLGRVASVTRLVKLYKYPVLGILAQRLVLRKGADIPRSVEIGGGVLSLIMHWVPSSTPILLLGMV